MKHCVFCAGFISKNQMAILAAKKTAEFLKDTFCLDEECVNCSYHSTVEVIENKDNFEVCLENNDTFQLIEDCMTWSVEYYKLRTK